MRQSRELDVNGRYMVWAVPWRVFGGMTPVSDGRHNKSGLSAKLAKGRVDHRRTVGLDIPCQVARLQSLTPLLQAIVE